MNTAINQNHGTGNGIAFLFGAAFNLLANVNLLFLLDYALQAIVGGIICLAFKIIADVFSPLWLKRNHPANYVMEKFLVGSRSSMFDTFLVGSSSSTWVSHFRGSISLALQLPSKEYIMAMRWAD